MSANGEGGMSPDLENAGYCVQGHDNARLGSSRVGDRRGGLPLRGIPNSELGRAELLGAGAANFGVESCYHPGPYSFMGLIDQLTAAICDLGLDKTLIDRKNARNALTFLDEIIQETRPRFRKIRCIQFVEFLKRFPGVPCYLGHLPCSLFWCIQKEVDDEQMAESSLLTGNVPADQPMDVMFTGNQVPHASLPDLQSGGMAASEDPHAVDIKPLTVASAVDILTAAFLSCGCPRLIPLPAARFSIALLYEIELLDGDEVLRLENVISFGISCARCQACPTILVTCMKSYYSLPSRLPGCHCKACRLTLGTTWCKPLRSSSGGLTWDQLPTNIACSPISCLPFCGRSLIF